MSQVKNSFQAKFRRSQRIQVLRDRYDDLAISGIRFRPESTGELRSWLNMGPLPNIDQLPSKVQGYRADAEQFAMDYAFLLDAMAPQIYPCENIVGEIYCDMDEVRPQIPENAEEIREKAEAAGKLGAQAFSRTHNCPDIAIVLQEGYDGILARIRKSLTMYTELNNERRAHFLRAIEMTCLACIRYIERYAALAKKLESETEDPQEKARFHKIGKCCEHVAHKAPENFYEAVQTVTFAILFDHAIAHGNGYGKPDLFLIDFYRRDIEAGTLTKEEAREYIAEMYLKLAGFFFGLCGRLSDGRDATNEMSYVMLEAYDMVETASNISVMWHSDINSEFYDYACDVLARHGEATPVLINWDIMYASELRSGIPHEDAWKVSYAGCQWYSIPGKEYCGHDTNYIDTMNIMHRALERALAEEVSDFEGLFSCYRKEVHRTLKAFQELEALLDRGRGEGMPELYASLLSHGPIERGLDITAPRGVDYQYTSVNLQGIPNVADSFTAIKALVFEQKQYTLQEVIHACKTDWENNEIMRQRFLNQPKFGNGITEADEMYALICNSMQDMVEGYINQRGGQPLRPCLYCYMNHVNKGVAATPDGRHKGDVFAHGINPQRGASKKGLIPMLNSVTAVDMRKFMGGSIQLDIQPRFFDGKEAHYAYIRDLTNAYFKSGGMHLNINIMDLKKLEDAIEHPQKPEYRDLTVRITGFSARFLAMTEDYQRDFVARENYGSI